MSEVQTTKLGRNWLIKTLAFLIILLVFGCWGLADALYFYPRRGEMDAARRLKDHLAAAEAAGMLSPAQLKIADPRATLAQLKSKEQDIAARAKQGGSEAGSARFQQTQRDWLEALARMWALRPEPRLVETDKGPPPVKYYYDMREGLGASVTASGTRTAVSPPELLKRLAASAATSNQVTPLSGFDMLFQWVFVAIGYGGGLWMLITVARAAAKKYRWEAQTQQLTMPDGKAVTPADIRELDKRLWHKFFCQMHLKDGGVYKLDLLRYQPLEEWVLAMEQTAFPELAEPGGGAESSPQTPKNEAAA